MRVYDHNKIESKWQKEWEKKKIYSASDKSTKKKFFSLIEFPYPSGKGLHVGHIRSNTAMDIISRKRRMEGFNVLYPIGWDAFGLPTENFAIKTGIQPAKVTKTNTDVFRKQLKKLGFSFDWSREINTTHPEYYKWTEWIFLQFFKKGLAYKAKAEINWCPKCKIGLANEEVVDGKCDRCGEIVQKKEKEQWMLGITKYADRLAKDLDLVDYPESVKASQRNWIGKSEGSEISFQIISTPSKVLLNSKIKKNALKALNERLENPPKLPKSVTVFTTRADTIFGATYLVLAPEHSLINEFKSQITNLNEVEEYIKIVKKKTETERTKEDKEKTGVELKGIKAINPANKEPIAIWIADYVLSEYGTGAIMAVPAHDERDFAFAKKFSLKIQCVVAPSSDFSFDPSSENLNKEGNLFKNKSDKEVLINSGEKFNGMDIEEARKKITKEVGGKIVTRYKLRDWVFSRQRYWGEPIPLIKCEKCGWIPVKDKDLPVILPKVKSYQPTDTGESPLANIPKWLNTKCPKCGGKAKRETDTMPNWAGSSWYYLRYIDPKNKKVFVNQKKLKYWSKDSSKGNTFNSTGLVDWYNGGMEHTTLHLLYSRFWHKFLYDLKLVPTQEPYKKRTSHGMILGEGGVKMSKSLGNVINPDDIIKTYGADTLRVYEMFLGPFEDAVAWSTESIIGPRRFIEKIWRKGIEIKENQESSHHSSQAVNPLISKKNQSSKIKKNITKIELQKVLHKTIKKVSEDIEMMRFNTAISTMMILINQIEKYKEMSAIDFKIFLKILAPFAPHIAEELWYMLGEKKSIHLSSWPKWNEKMILDDEVKIAIQVNGKVRAEMIINIDEPEEEIKEKAVRLESIQKYFEGRPPKKIIFVAGRLLNIVV